MTFAPKTLTALANYWTANGGVNLGIVGNAAHTIGYHLGRDRIYGPDGIGDQDYSVQYIRDKAGLSNAAAALDLGELHGSLVELRAFSNWLVDQAMHNATVRRDIREIIYSPDGKIVQRWSGIDNSIHTGAGNGDSSHLQHTHLSYFRDSEQRDKIAVFRPYFEDDMTGLMLRFVDRVNGIATVTGSGHALIRTDNQLNVPIPAGQKREVTGRAKLLAATGSHPAGTEGFIVGKVPDAADDSVVAFLLASDCTFTPDPVADCSEWTAWYEQAPKA